MKARNSPNQQLCEAKPFDYGVFYVIKTSLTIAAAAGADIISVAAASFNLGNHKK